MKILRIELLNLNSLAGRHVIELDRGPLAGAGLFAITGPTGAGKSTILDAITLALFGRAARYASTKNPEDMMTRHTGECSAEVTFSVPSGTFRAAWQLARARKKPDGKAQPAKRYLYDADGAAVTQKFGDMDREIAALTGLDADRFLRSVLLAQGEFSRFLKSKPNERAELLESLTGTAVYSELGELAHREYSERERALDLKRAALGNLELLTEEAREAATLSLQRAKTDTAELTARLNGMRETRQLALHFQKTLTDAAALDAAVVALDEKQRQAGPELARLAGHRAALPFLPGLVTADQAERRAVVARERADALRTAAGKARAASDAGKAAALRLARALEETTVAAGQTHAATVARQKEIGAEVKRMLDAAAADRALAEVLPDLFDALAAAETAERDRKAARDAQLRNSQECGAAVEKTKTAAVTLQTVTAARDGARALATEAARLFTEAAGGEGLEGIARKLDALRERRGRLDELLKLLAAERKLAEDGAKQAAEREGNTKETKEAKVLGEAMTARVGTLRELLDGRGRERDLAGKVASLEEQRKALVEGEACPLCGAAEHPWAHGNTGALTEREAETAFRKTDAEWRAATAEQSKAAAKIAALEATAKALERGAEALAKTRAEAAAGVKTLAELLAVSPPESAQAARDATDEEGKAVRALSDRIAKLREAAEAAEKARGAAEATFAKAEAEARAAAEAAGVLQKRAEECAAACESADRACAMTAEAANRKLAPFSLTLSAEVSAESLRAELKARATRFAGWEKALTEAAAVVETARGKAREVETALTDIRQRAAAWGDAGDPTDQADPTDPAPGTPRPQPGQEAAWRDLPEAEAALVTLARAAENAEATAAEAEKQAAAARTEAEDAARTLQETLAGSAFPDAAALRAAALDEPTATTLANQETTLREEAAALETRRRVNGETREALAAAGAAPPEKLPELEQALTEAEQAHRALVESAATQAAALARDAENRRLHAERGAELAAESERLGVWRRLHTLIGSADGGKFRTFAQGLSLDALLRRANRHLAKLTDRYLLLRDTSKQLELVIEDLHQAGARRPMESLSGGESFLASLALALGLSDLAGRNVRIDSLFIDEGFGTLDADTLDTALCALESLRQADKTIGVISHVGLLKERIGTQINVEKTESGLSRIRIVAG